MATLRRRARLFVACAATVGLLGGGLLATAPASAEPDPSSSVPVSVVYSSSDGSRKLEKPDDLAFGPITSSNPTTLGVDTTSTGQTLDGIGGSLESSSVYNIANLSAENRTEVMNALFDTETGNGYDLMRLSFGCPDFCAEDFYTYDDLPDGQTDPSLSNFSIQKDIDGQIISVAQQALAINPDVEFFASAWTPPAWMKDNNSLNNGGSVLPEYYPVLAQYYKLAILAYAEHGIPIKALTVANEPTVVPDYPSSQWTWEQERDFIPFLRAALDSAGLSTEIWIQDDNWWTTSQFANILADPVVGPMVDGVGVHDYDDGDVTQAARLVEQYPDVTVRLTERSYYDVKGMDRLVQLFRNDVSSWTYWLTFLDEDGLPNAGPLDGDSFPQQIGAPHDDLNAWYLDRDYYLYAQFSRFLDRGAVRIESDYGTTGTVTNVVFRNPDGEYVAIVVNQTDYDQAFRLVDFDGQVADTLPAATVGTYTWRSDTTPVDRAGWSASASLQDWGSAAMLDGDTGTAWRNFSAQAAGQSVTIDTGSAQLFDQLTLDSGTIENGASSNDWPRGYILRSSLDGTTWSEPLATGRGAKRFTNITFSTVEARYFRVELTKPAPTSYWSVAEVYAFAGQPVAANVTASTAPAVPDGSDGWFRTAPVTVTLALQQGTVPATLEYSVDAGPWAPYSAAISVSGDGSHSVGYRAVQAGVPVEGSAGAVAVKIDRTAPTVSAQVDAPTRTLTVSATDATSGVAAIEYRLGTAGAWSPYTAPVAVPDATTTTPVSYRATDAAGNVSAVGATTVAGKPASAAIALKVTAVSKCVAGKAVVVVTTKNAGAGKVDVRSFVLASTKTNKGLAAGGSVAPTFASKKVAIPAGTAIVTGVSTVKGSAALATYTARYAAINCR